MKNKIHKQYTTKNIMLLLMAIFIISSCIGNKTVYAQDAETNIDGKYYEFDKKSDYEFSEAESFKSTADIQC